MIDLIITWEQYKKFHMDFELSHYPTNDYSFFDYMLNLGYVYDLYMKDSKILLSFESETDRNMFILKYL